MTQTQHSPQTRKIELTPNQVYIKRPGTGNRVHTLVEGATDWTYYFWDPLNEASLYYQGIYVTTLSAREDGTWVDGHFAKPDPGWPLSIPPQYASLAEAVATYEQAPESLAGIDRWNKAQGLEQWCIRQSFTPSPVSLKLVLPPEERQRLERLAQFDALSLEALALEALYKHLAQVEKRFNDFQRRQQRKSEQNQEASAEVGA